DRLGERVEESLVELVLAYHDVVLAYGLATLLVIDTAVHRHPLPSGARPVGTRDGDERPAARRADREPAEQVRRPEVGAGWAAHVTPAAGDPWKTGGGPFASVLDSPPQAVGDDAQLGRVAAQPFGRRSPALRLGAAPGDLL